MDNIDLGRYLAAQIMDAPNMGCAQRIAFKGGTSTSTQPTRTIRHCLSAS